MFLIVTLRIKLLNFNFNILLAPACGLHAPLQRRHPPSPQLVGLGLRVFFCNYFGFFCICLGFSVFVLGFWALGFKVSACGFGLWVFACGFGFWARGFPACGFGL